MTPIKSFDAHEFRERRSLFYQSYYQQVQRVVDIKQPFHETVDAGAFTALAVVHFYDRDRENDAHLKNAVDLINSEEVHDGVERNIEHQPERLLFQIAAVRAEGEDAERGDTAPVAREGDKADEDDNERDGLARQALTVRGAEHYKPPRERPHDACLVERLPVIKRDERVPIDKIIGEKDIAEVRDKGEGEKTEGVFIYIARIVVALGDEEAHDGTGDAPDKVHQEREQFMRVARPERPRDMVDRHGGDGDELDGVGIKPAFFHVGHKNLRREKRWLNYMCIV